ncbi:sulfotransferase [Actinomadura fibrosa]|uniref:Sulfotransferase n=1 Tax=Actinomadura fibrosa TaxID=111802 RepID=A0ABW2XNZ9_9ACTN|nr:sulfotransferase [Actinomadura fibrosa]
MPDVIVLSTGRCGSTLVTKFLASHPDVLGLSEFFAALPREALLPDSLNGRGFWDRLTGIDHPVTRLHRLGLPLPSEALYGSTGGRFPPGAVPAICVTTLPALSDDPDSLFDELSRAVCGRPYAPMREHYRGMCAWLCRRLGGGVVVERSGASLGKTAALRGLFPEAKYVLLLRDGMETSISMSRRPLFRLAAQDQRRLRGGRRHIDAAGEQVAIEEFGRLWSGMICAGTSALTGIPAEQLLVLTYEELVEDARAQLRRLAAFIGVDAFAEWLSECDEQVEPPPLRAGGLSEGDRAALRRSCAAGGRALHRFLAAHGASPGTDHRVGVRVAT